MKKLTFIDLFAGIGGFHYGLNNFADCVFTSEINKKARESYLNNHTTNIMNTDITGVEPKDIPDHNILCAGFPCQPFSVMGKKQGVQDQKGVLIFNIINILKEKQPDCFFLENVKNLLAIDGGNTFKQIIEELEDSGYFVTYQVINSLTHGGVPQNRERIFIIGFKNKNHFSNFSFPQPIPLDITIEDILESPEEVPVKLRHNTPHLESMVAGYVYTNRYGNKLRRHNVKGVCPTLLSSVNTSPLNGPLVRDSLGTRRLTPRECLRLQGFPESFVFPEEITLTQRFIMVGNSVTVGVIRAIADNIYKSLTFDDSKTNMKTPKKERYDNSFAQVRQLALF